MSNTLKKIDIVVCTALIPGKKAPVILKENMIDNMQSGSIIYDLAAIQGGNTALTKVDKIVEKKELKFWEIAIFLTNSQFHRQLYMQKMYLILFQIY